MNHRGRRPCPRHSAARQRIVRPKGLLQARLPADNARFERLLGKGLPRFGETMTSGSLLIGRASGLPRLVVHLSPVSTAKADFGLKPVAVLALVVDPVSQPRVNRDLIGAAFDLTPSQAQVAVMLAEGRSVRDIAAVTGRQASTVRYLLKQVYDKQGLTGRADLVRLVLSLTELPRS